MFSHRYMGAALLMVAALGVLTLLPASQAAAQELPQCPIGGVPMVACPAINDAVVQGIISARLTGTIVNGPEDQVQVRVCEGVATLTGHVRGDLTRQSAGDLAARVPGVKSVVNEIRVIPITNPDLQLVQQVRQRLAKTLGNFNQVNVQAANGVVQLSGVVRSELERDMAEIAAGSVQGVAAVHNNIYVRGVWGNNY